MIAEELQEIIEETDMKMDDAVQYLKKEFTHIRAGKANPALIEHLPVEYYGAQTPLRQLASISAPEPRMLLVQPYDKSSMHNIEKAIMVSNLGLNPSNDGSVIRIPLPILTEERRKELAKLSKDYAEKARISIRSSRREANESIKKAVAEHSLPEDSRFEAEAEVQTLTDKHTRLVEEILVHKEEEIMTV